MISTVYEIDVDIGLTNTTITMQHKDLSTIAGVFNRGICMDRVEEAVECYHRMYETPLDGEVDCMTLARMYCEWFNSGTIKMCIAGNTLNINHSIKLPCSKYLPVVDDIGLQSYIKYLQGS
jgi:hypothetical protein